MTSHVFNKKSWAGMTMFEQMGNIGLEVGRALKAMRHGDEDSMNGAFYRGMDLIDYTAELWGRAKSPRTKELLRAKEVFAEAVLNYQDDPKLEDYFFQYALAARRNR